MAAKPPLDHDARKHSPIADATVHSRPHRKGGAFIVIGAVVVLIIVIISFVVAPALQNSAGGTSVNFGSYGNRDITYGANSYFAGRVDQLTRQYQSQGYPVDTVSYYIWQSAFNQAVVRAAWLYEAYRAGVFPPDEASIRRAVRQSQYFVGRDGSFDETAYVAASPQMRDNIVKAVSEDLALGNYQSDLLSYGIYADDSLDFMIGVGGAPRRFEMASFAFADYPKSELAKYAETNANLFRRRQLERVVTPGPIKNAIDLAASVSSGAKTFEDVAGNATKRALGPTATIPLPGGAPAGNVEPRYYYEIRDELLNDADTEKVFALKVGQISEPARLAGEGESYVFYKCVSVSPDFDSTDEKALADVFSYLNAKKKSVLSDYYVNLAKSLASSGSGFIAGAQERGAVAFTTDYFTSNYNMRINPYSQSEQNSPFGKTSANFGKALTDAGGSVAAEAIGSQKFFQTAFSLKTGEVSAPVDLPSSIVVMRYLDEKVPEAVSEYDRGDLANYLVESAFEAQNGAFLKSPLFKNRFNKQYARLFSPQKGVQNNG